MTCDTLAVPVPVITDSHHHIFCPSSSWSLIYIHSLSYIEYSNFCHGIPIITIFELILVVTDQKYSSTIIFICWIRKTPAAQNIISLSLITSTVSHQDYSDSHHRILITIVSLIVVVTDQRYSFKIYFICSVKKLLLHNISSWLFRLSLWDSP